MKFGMGGIIAGICFGLAIFFFTAKTETEPSELGQKIKSDLETLQLQAYFPTEFENLEKIRILFHAKNDQIKKSLRQDIAVPFSEKSGGTHSLQIDVIDNFEPPEEAILILQFNLFENETQNKIWESSRLYQLTPSELEEIKRRPIIK